MDGDRRCLHGLQFANRVENGLHGVGIGAQGFPHHRHAGQEATCRECGELLPVQAVQADELTERYNKGDKRG